MNKFIAGWKAEGAAKQALKATKRAEKTGKSSDKVIALDKAKAVKTKLPTTRTGRAGMRARQHAPKAAVGTGIAGAGTVAYKKRPKKGGKKNGKV